MVYITGNGGSTLSSAGRMTVPGSGKTRLAMTGLLHVVLPAEG